MDIAQNFEAVHDLHILLGGVVVHKAFDIQTDAALPVQFAPDGNTHLSRAD